MLRVELNGCSSLVSGPGAPELIRSETDRLAVYLHRLRGFSVSEETARSVVGRAEHLGYAIELVPRRSARARALDALRAAPAPRWPEQPDPGADRW